MSTTHIATLHEGKTFSKRQSRGQPVEVGFISHREYISLQRSVSIEGFTVDSGFIHMPEVSAGHLIQMRNILICQCGKGAQTQADGMSRPFIGVSIW